ncbi:putative oxidoreductase of aldo/keto reductase family [Thaumarchaeota archaeon SCGC AB-539-E09]|nr:putative oxidoreductase of aldo/keto reductase family [Thaumarchaeota archaeon SCGC AB-539-E09]
MKKVRLGRTNLKVKNLGFGGIPIQRVSEKDAVGVVRRCYELGIDYYDTARGYSVSEERMGIALQDVRDDVVIATKSGRRTADELWDELQTSLRNLRTDRIDVYQLHNISDVEAWEKVKAPGGAMEAMYRAKDEGLIDHLGITSHDPVVLADIVKEEIFATIMIPYNYLTPIPEEALLPLCKKMDVATICMKPFGGGVFSNANTALKFVLGSGKVDITIPGMMSVEEVEENVAVSTGDLNLSTEEYALIEKDKIELGSQFCRACGYCQPCPQEIPITFILRAEKQFIKRMGWREGLEEQLQNAIEKADTCIECGDCEGRCPYHLPIRELLKDSSSSLKGVLESRQSIR